MMSHPLCAHRNIDARRLGLAAHGRIYAVSPRFGFCRLSECFNDLSPETCVYIIHAQSAALVKSNVPEDEGDGTGDHSLQAKSLDRALNNRVPKTLTPYEWEEWYSKHGVPDTHREHQSTARFGWFGRWLKHWR